MPSKPCKNCRKANKEDGDYCAGCLAGKRCQSEVCDIPVKPGDLYCKECGKELLKRLKEAGHLTPAQRFPGAGDRRSGEAKEDTYVTKHGTGR